MANYATLKTAIQQVIKTNGNNEITGAIMQSSLLSIIDSLGNGYEYAGMAKPTTNPGTPDQRVFYIASTSGTYPNFSSIVLDVGEVAILRGSGSTWTKETAGFATAEQIALLEKQIALYSLTLSFVGKGNTYSYGNPSGGFIPNQIYRIFIPVNDWDMTGVTSTGVRFNIDAYNNKECSTSGASNVGINILKVYIGGTISGVYDVYLPETVNKNGADITVKEWFLRISGRAANDVIVVAIAELHNELVNTGITVSYNYSTTGSKEDKTQYYNFQKGHIYEFTFDTTGLGDSKVQFNLYKDGVPIKNFGAPLAGVNTYNFIPEEDIFGAYLRFYINSGGTGPFTSSIRDISIETLSSGINGVSANVERMNLVSIFSTDLQIGSLYSNNVDLGQPNLRYTPQYYEVVPGSSISFQYGERTDGKEIRVRVQFVTSNKTFITPNDAFSHLTSKTVPSTAAYCRFVFGLYDNGTQVAPDINDAEITIQIPGRVVIIDEALKELKGNILVKEKQDLTDEQINTVRQNLQLGGDLSVSFTKTSSSHSSTVNRLNISVKKGKVVKFGLFTEIVNPSVTGEFFAYGKDGNSISFGNTYVNRWVFAECPFDLEYIGVYLTAATTTGTYTIKAIGGVADDPQKNGVDIISINRGAIERIIAARCQSYSSPTDFGNYGNDGYNRFLAFLQMTDTHANFTCMKRAMEFADNSGLISQVFHTGDIIESSNAAGRKETEWAKLLNAYNSPILSIPGNHEFSANPPYTDAEIHSWLYNSAYQTRNGETHPTINGDEKNYWHKDVICPDYYEDGVLKTGKKIRIIGTYDFEFPDSEVGGVTGRKDKCWYTQEQIDWFVGKLDETLSDDFVGVMVLSHYILSKSKYIDTDFVPDSRRGVVADGDIMASNLIVNSNQYFFGQILNAFVNGGTVNTSVTLEMANTGISTTLVCNHTFASAGKFIANICGHKHAGGMLQMLTDETTINENLRVVLSPCSTNNDHQNTKWWGRSLYNEYISYPNDVDCLNVIVYDHIRNKVKVVRVGSVVNNDLVECKTFVF